MRPQQPLMETPGNLFVVAAPSGAGKSSLVKALLELDSHLAVSVSHTTRAPRGQEQDGREYWFIDEPAFKATFTLTATVASNFLAVGNMPVMREETISASQKRVSFAPTPKMSSYLFVFTAGELDRITANAGGVTVSYFEWVQNRQGYYWTIGEIHDRLKASMEAEGRAIWTCAKEHGITLRSAAYVHALGRLAEAIEAHGTQQFFTS